jgi:hypothetical protein
MDPLVLFLLLLAVYFLPAYVAYRRFHPNAVPILLLNLFLGWTLVGWVAALVWAAMAHSNIPQPRALAPVSRVETPNLLARGEIGHADYDRMANRVAMAIGLFMLAAMICPLALYALGVL